MSSRLSATLVGGLALALQLAAPPVPAGSKDQPERVTVQHILIAFGKTLRDKELERTKREAKALAEELLERAQAGEEFDKLVLEYTDDSPPGVFKLANHDVQKTGDERARDDMVVCFGDVSFKLAVGEVGLASYFPERCPFGWHVIKRLE
jgi:foldase protein PrsA